MPTDTAYSSAILLGGCRMPLVSVEFSHCVNCMQGIIKKGVVMAKSDELLLV